MKSGSVTVRIADREMRPRGLPALAYCVALCVAIIALQPVSARAEGMRRPAPSAEQIVSHLKERLNLSDAQAKKIQPIMEESMRKQTELRKEMMQLRQATDAKINAVLSPEQQKQFQMLKDERRGRLRGRMQKPQAPAEDEP